MKQLFKGEIYANYYTFYLQDKASPQDYATLANADDFEKMLSVGNQMLHINTKRYESVPVSVILFNKKPRFNPDTCERANECSLEITTVAVLGDVIGGFTELPLEAGIYGVRILYKNLSSVQSDWVGRDKYVLQLWRISHIQATTYLKYPPQYF
jgi:hypothetical protein